MGAVKALIEAGADVNHTANDGYGFGKDLFILKELFRAGCKINLSDYNVRRVYNGKPDRKVVALLLAAGESTLELGKIPKCLRPPK